MKRYRILLAGLSVLILTGISYGGAGTASPDLKAQVITSNGSMRLVRYTRNSPDGQATHFIRRSPVGSDQRLVASTADHARMQSQYAVRRPDAGVVQYAPVGGTVTAKATSPSPRLQDGYGKVYRQPSYSHAAYLRAESTADETPVRQGNMAERRQRVNVYGAKRASQNVVVVNDIAWSDGCGNSVKVKCKRHHRHCGCNNKGYSYGVHWGRGSSYGRGYSCTVRETYMIRGSYPRALGNGMYVYKQPRYGYGNYGVRVVARTSHYGHTLTIGGGGCSGGKRY